MIKSKNNEKFWNKFYKKRLIHDKPSNFALFILKFLKKKNTKIVDVGCGNGRDIFYFKKNKIDFFGLELSKSAKVLKKSK